MAADVVEEWLASCQPACVNGMCLRPVEHGALKGTPLSIQKGQAEAFCLIGDDGRQWILKKFHAGRQPERGYLEAIRSVLPKGEGFLSGTARDVLSSASLTRGPACHCSAALAFWVDGTVLMPRISGIDWASIADEVRDGRVRLERVHRLALCMGLTTLVAEMERHQCCHRDLSSGNVFVDTRSWEVRLIDFDSLYHPTLPFPAATTCGTAGYTAPFTWRNGGLDPAVTWCAHADRFAMTLLNVEFLVLGPGAPLTAEGGMFDQDELRARRGHGLEDVRTTLKSEYPQVVPLLESGLQSAGFEACPSPEAWNTVLDAVPGGPVKPPRLDELEILEADFFKQLLKKRRPAAPLWPAPSLHELPPIDVRVPRTAVPVVTLPPDPWETGP